MKLDAHVCTVDMDSVHLGTPSAGKGQSMVLHATTETLES
jgi:hypothetical protein